MPSLIYQIPGIRQLQAKLNQLTSYVPPPRRVDTNQPLKILMVHAHPDPVKSFSAAIAHQVEQSTKEAGHEIRRISLYKEGFQPQLTKQEHTDHHDTGQDLNQRRLAPEIKDYVRLLLWCDTLIFVYPTWWMNTPAILKGFMDRTLVHDICWKLPTKAGDAFLVPKLNHIRQIVGVSTYGAPYHVVTLAGDNGRRMIANAMRPVISPAATVAWLGLYGMDDTTHAQRTDFLGQVDQIIKGL